MNQPDLQRVRLDRFRVLHRLYVVTGGDRHARVPLGDIGSDLAIEEAPLRVIAQYLVGEGLMEFRTSGPTVGLTHQGIRAVEEALSNPEKSTDYFPPAIAATGDPADRLLERISAVLTDHFHASHTRFTDSVSSMANEWEARGMYHSSGFVQRLDILAEEELRKRSELVLEIWERMIGAFPEDARAIPEAKMAESVSEALRAEAQRLTEMVAAATPKQIELRPKSLDEQLVRSTERLRHEIVARIARSTTAPEIVRQSDSGSAAQSVFLVHGHDQGTKETVARFLEKLGLHVVILHEQPNQGQTIIEKLELHAAVGFAVVLLSPDDIGGSVSTPKDLKPRARQNVIFELGFFCSSLGRSRVCVLYGEGVELPTDYSGVLFIPLREGWQSLLARELRAAGLPIKLDGLLQ